MAETHELRLKINAAAARSGSREFVGALAAIRTAVTNLDQAAGTAFRGISRASDAAAASVNKNNTAYNKQAEFIKKAQAATRAYVAQASKQEGVTLSAAASLRRASEDAARLSERMRRIGDTQGVNSINAALLSLKASMASGVTSTLQLRRATDEYSQASSRAKISLTQKEAAQRRAADSARVLAKQETDAANAARRVEREMRSIVGATSAASRAMRDATGSMRGLENAFSGTFQIGSAFRVMLGSITFGTFAQSVYQAGTTLEQFRVTMEVATGSAAAAAKEVQFVDDMSRNLGTNLRGAREDFAKFAVSANLAGVNTATTRDIFESVAMAMSVMGRGAEDQRLAFLALEQMLSKNVVSSEELRRQLGERLPGAVNLMARAVGVSTAELQKMLKAGSLVSSEVLPKFAKEVRKAFGPGFSSATQRASYNIGTFKVEMEKLLEVVANSGFMDAVTTGMRDLTAVLRSDEASVAAAKLGEGLALLAKTTFTLANAFATNFDLIARIAKAVIAGVLVRQSLLMVNAIGISLRGVLSLRDGFTALSAGAVPAAAGINAVTVAGGRLGVVLRGLGLIAGPIGLALTAISLLAMSVRSTGSDSEDAAFTYEDAMDRMRTSTFAFVDRAKQKLDEDVFSGLNKNIDSAVAALMAMEKVRARVSSNSLVEQTIQETAIAPVRTDVGKKSLLDVASKAKAFIAFTGTIEEQKKSLDQLKGALDRAVTNAPEAYEQLKALSVMINDYGRAVETASVAQGRAADVISSELVDEAINSRFALEGIRAQIQKTAEEMFSNATSLTNALISIDSVQFAKPIQALQSLQDRFTGSAKDVEDLNNILKSLSFDNIGYAVPIVQSLSDNVTTLTGAIDAESVALEGATVRVDNNSQALAVAAGQAANAATQVYGFIQALNAIPGIQINMAATLEGAMSGIKERVRLAQITDQTENKVERALTTGPVAKAIEAMTNDYKAAEAQLEGLDTSNPAYQGIVDKVTETSAQLQRSKAELRAALTEAELAEEKQRDIFSAQNKAERKASGGGNKGRTSALYDESKALQNLQDDILKRAIALENEERVLGLLANGTFQYRESAELMAESMRLNNGVIDESTKKRIGLLDAQQRLNEQLQKAATNPLQDWLDDVQTFDMMMKDVQATLAEGISGVIQGVIQNGELDFTQLLDNLSSKLATFVADNLTKSLFENTGLGDLFGGAAQGSSAAAQMQAAMTSGGATAAAQMRAAMTGSAAPIAGSIQAAHQTGAAVNATAIQTAGTVNAATTLASGQAHAAAVGTTIQLTGQQHAAAVGAATQAGAAGGGGMGILGWIGSLFGVPVGAEGFTTGSGGVSPTARATASPASFRHAPSFSAGTQNTSGIPAILHPNEAVIPLTKGRKVPVDMGDAGGGTGGSIYAPAFTFGDIVVNVEGGDSDSEEQAELIAETISATIDNKINERLAENMQYGGMMRPRGS